MTPKKFSLLLEGTQDGYVVGSIVKKEKLYFLQVNGSPKIADNTHNLPVIKGDNCGGINKLLPKLPNTVSTEISADSDAIGIIIDADENIGSAWAAVCTRLQEVEKLNALTLAIPSAPNPNGTILNYTTTKGQSGKIGIWIMPDNTSSGVLENFVQTLFPAPNPLMDLAKRTVADIFADDITYLPATKFSKVKIPKAEIHTWLAWQPEPPLQMGQAILASSSTDLYKTATYPIFVDWLKRLYS